MKTKKIVLFFFLAFVISLQVLGQKLSESRVPKDVLMSFKYKYPEATEVSWDMFNGKYQATFNDNNQKCSALFNESGIWQYSSYTVAKKELPPNVFTYIANNATDANTAIESAVLQKYKSGNSIYCVHIVKGSSSTLPDYIYFDLAGKYLSENPEKNSDSKNSAISSQTNGNSSTIVNNDPNPLSHPYDANKVPKEIYNILLTKVKKPIDLEWYYYNMIFTVIYKSVEKGGNLNGSSVITKEGVWIETRLEQPVATLHPLITDYLKSNYKNYLIKSAELVSVPKDKSLLLKIYDKKSKQTPPPLTEIWFSTTGKFISATEPEEDIQETVETDDGFASQYDKKEVVFNQDENYYQKVNYKELPSSIHTYMTNNYKDYLIKSSKLITDEELGNVYVIAAKKDVDRYAELVTFDLNGKFLKAENEGGISSQSKPEAKQQTNSTKTQKEKPSKYGSPEEKVEVDELPEVIKTYAKKYYPQYAIAESYLKQDDETDGNYLLILKKTGEKKVVKLSFDNNGKLLKKEIEE
jgi:hypothetical protein